MTDAAGSPASNNYILASLPEEELSHLLPYLRLVRLEQGTLLYPARQPIDQVLFPTTGVISWVATTQEGDRVETGIIGWEGIVGASVVLGDDTLPFQIEVQLPGEAQVMPADRFQSEFDQCPILQSLVLRFLHTGLVQLAQSAACNRYHTVEARLCRWLLTASDRANSDRLVLTQDTLAGMIGARRPAVTIALGTLQSAGLIQARRGEIRLLNRENLEAATCECYSIVRQALEQFLHPL
ncbi:MAG: Crp/Fnr family transcriptional regulator [Synechococcales cyanobacterium C42_A2020_086]|jgi:CRP-like cAMP-binding protein|nr:Crp/Fnr family transcriptional regulator [Synechococcales cyanobacterium M58_A2018_015]MBF2073720.1 Crp/Fnr family transcriptional regulator [Synechococcales cyanobacterium C42_A2020_086]